LTPEAHARLADAQRHWKRAQAHMAETIGHDGLRRLLRDLASAVDAVHAE
jgi:hypothetical protein